MKEVTPTADLLVSWIPSMITIDGNSKHLVIYLSYPYWNETEEVECYSEQFLFEIYLVGPEKAKHSHHFGNSVVYSVKQTLENNGVSCRNVNFGAGFKSS